MDIYITEKETGTRIALSMLPEKTKRRSSTKFQNYDIINLGEIKLPKGTKLLAFSWSGTFPGLSRVFPGLNQFGNAGSLVAEMANNAIMTGLGNIGEAANNKSAILGKAVALGGASMLKEIGGLVGTPSYLKFYHWRDPKTLEGIFDKWRKEGTKLILMVTETFINHEVILADFTPTNKGGHGDIDYDVTFIESKDIRIYTTAETNTKSETRPAPAEGAAKTHNVVPGDTLWAISQKYLGNGARYPEIHELNKSVIGSDPDKIYPGQALTLPN